jgi:hypothetical protein
VEVVRAKTVDIFRHNTHWEILEVVEEEADWVEEVTEKMVHRSDHNIL